MRCFTRPASAAIGLLALFLALAAQAAAAQISIESAALRPSHGLYVLDTTLRFGIIGEPLKALRSGVPLTLLIESEVTEPRDYLWDRRIGGVSQRYRVEHHALSSQYLVTNLVNGEQHGFPSIEEAADALGEIREIPVLDRRLLQPGRRYEASVRARLDAAALPGPLRLIAYFAPEWRVASPWFRWAVEP